ncbi:T9SS type A sorting domain-containing protein [candidate division KSB1 bacterium]|nr:T9SS type A sorting domain-containing protein [candidate division KSB1 bacterium]
MQKTILTLLVLSIVFFSISLFAQSDNNPAIWITPEEIAMLPDSGQAWENVLAAASRNTNNPDLSNQEDMVNVWVLAKALVYVRTGNEKSRNQVIQACSKAIDTELGGRTLALGRELISYVIAARLVGLPEDRDRDFRAWLRRTLTENLGGRTLQSTHEDRPNNWGTHAGASRIAVALYLNDQQELQRAAQVFKGWLGDRQSYAGFQYGDPDWQADPEHPVGINPAGSTINNHSVDGVLPDDMRRAGGFTWPPPQENYVYEGLQGALAQAVLLSKAGYDVWNWQDQALLRAFTWLHEEANFPAAGDDTWQPHIINYFHGTSFPAPVPARPGKNVGWTDWTHGTPPVSTPVVMDTLTLHIKGNGLVTLNPDGGIYERGTTVTLNTRPDSGWIFQTWNGDIISNEETAVMTMDGNKTVEATFIPLYTLTTRTDGTGNILVDPLQEFYPPGTEVTLTALADSNWEFNQWSGDCSGTEEITTLLIENNCSVTAHFSRITSPPPPVETIALLQTLQGASGSQNQVTTSGVFNTPSNALYLAAISTKPYRPVIDLDGLGLSWEKLKAQPAGRSQTGVEIWMARGMPTENSTITADLQSAPLNALISVVQYQGVDTDLPLGTVTSVNTNGIDGAASGGNDSDAYSFSFSTTTAQAQLFSAVAMRHKTHTPGSGYAGIIQLHQGSGGDMAGLALQQRTAAEPQTLTVEGAFSGSVDWAVIAIELRPASTLQKQYYMLSSIESSKQLPERLTLEQNFPNPFNPTTTLRYHLAVSGPVRLTIINMRGQVVANPVNGYQKAGTHETTWSALDDFGRPLASGVYVYRLEANDFVKTKKMHLLR